MAASTATSSCKTTPFFRLPAPKLSPSRKFAPLTKQFVYSYGCSSSSLGITRISVRSPIASTLIPRSVEAVVEESAAPPSDSEDDIPLESGSIPLFTGGCKACGKVEIERGCNEEGRIQGGIATVPGFGWWPIKAYRPCPAYVASGGRYRRIGQSMDEVVSGRGGAREIAIKKDKAESSKEKEGPKKVKKS